MHSMQEFKQTGQWLDIGLSRKKNDNISDNNDNYGNGHSHSEQHPRTAPDLPSVTGSCQSRYPLREIGDQNLIALYKIIKCDILHYLQLQNYRQFI